MAKLLYRAMFLLPFVLGVPARAETLSGPAEVVDASSLSVGGRKVRLHGIAAPAIADICAFRNKTIPCGQVAASALMDLTAGTGVVCESRGVAGASTLATCTAGGYDLSEGMVYTGWARPLAGAPARYFAAQKKAQRGSHGLWQGRFPKAVDQAANR